ncbi:site-specific integrase [Desulfovibrio sp. OttesenSCG-928-C14]|nr:site-specific integrase [Desulfovibrio sp. OttesenSCG-928-C14]
MLITREVHMKLTKTAVERLEKTGARYEVRDDDVPGFLVRVGIDGAKSFYFSYRAGKGRGAQKKRLHLGAFPKITVEQARALAKEKAAAVTLGADPAAALREDKAALYVAEALDAFHAEYVVKLKPSTISFYEVIIEKHLKPAMGKVRAKQLGYADVARLHASMKSKPYMANRCIAVISVFLNWCELHGYRDKNSNPCKEIKLYKEQKRQEFMGATELAILGETLERMEKTWHERQKTKEKRTAKDVDTITPQAAAAIRLLMFTGARRGEILALKWDYIDLERGLARLPDSKTGFKVLQLPAPAVTVLKGLPQISEYVFPSPSAVGHMVNIKDAWADVLKQSGLTGWRIHDLRHAFASMMVNSGASLPIVGKILGHTQASTTARYAHLEENPARKAAEAAAAAIAESMSKPAGKVIRFPKTGEANT